MSSDTVFVEEMLERRLVCSVIIPSSNRTILSISFPAKIAHVLSLLISSAAIGMPVLWAVVCEGRGLSCLSQLQCILIVLLKGNPLIAMDVLDFVSG